MDVVERGFGRECRRDSLISARAGSIFTISVVVIIIRGSPQLRSRVKALNQDVFRSLSGSDAEDRKAAFALFQELDMPNPKQEAWRYVEVDFDLDDHHLADPGAEPLADDVFLAALEASAGRVTIVNGHIHSIEAVAGFDVTELTDRSPSSVLTGELDKFSAANAAFGVGGVSVRVPAGKTIKAPLVIDVQQVSDRSIGFPSISVSAEDNSEASVIVVLRSSDGAATALAPSLSVAVGNAARLSFSTVQILDRTSLSVAHQRVTVGRDATIRLGEVGLGGRYARLDLGIELVGNGSSADLIGLSFGEHDQVMDYRVVVSHVGTDTSSNVFLKGAVEDEAQSVFSGLLRIEKDAVRTSAFETNRNLVLSPGAKAHSVPNLEILCDDVVCGHGSSVGPLEEEHVYYLQSRGLSRSRAERVLIRGFFNEVIDRLPAPGLADPLRDAVNQRFVEAQIEGRIG